MIDKSFTMFSYNTSALSWIAAEWRYAYYRKRHNEMFTLGDGTQYFGYVNKNLPPGHSYYAFIRVQYNNSVGNYQHASTRLSDPIKMLEIALPSQSSNAQFNTIILAAIVGGFFFLSAIVFLVFRRKRYSGKQPYSSGIQVNFRLSALFPISIEMTDYPHLMTATP